MAIRRIEPGQGPTYKAVRLRALADAPDAFSSTLEHAEAFPDSVLEDRAVATSAGDEAATFFAHDAEVVAGMVAAITYDRPAGVCELVSMWVDPTMRSAGHGRTLVNAVIEWAAAAGLTTIELWVNRDNLAAQTLYYRCGFREVATPATNPHDACADQMCMQFIV